MKKLNHLMLILAYHGVSYKPDNGYNVSVDEFNEQMRWLFDSGYITIKLNELLTSKVSGSDRDRPRFMLTFDDGHKSNFDIVLPIIEKYGYKGIFFVQTGLIGKNEKFMDWAQVGKLFDKGNEIQSHGHSHRFLSHLTRSQITFELEESKNLITRYTSVVPEAFSCPGGRYNREVCEIAKALGYKKMFTSDPSYFIPEDCKNIFSFGRLVIINGMKFDYFKRLVAGDKFISQGYRARHYLKGCIRNILGDMKYHAFYKICKKPRG